MIRFKNNLIRYREGLLLLTIFPALQVCAQKKDSTSSDTTLSRIDWSASPTSLAKTFPYKRLIFPTTLIIYGVVSQNSSGLTNVNQKMREEVYYDHQPRPTRIDDYLRYVPALSVYGLNAVGIKGKNNFRDRTVILGMSQLIMSAIVFPVKKFSTETRPDGSDRFSFPSGHTACAFAGAEFLRQEYKDVSPWYGVAGYAIAGATGYLRMYNNKHWMSDVIAGAGVGILSTRLAYWLYPGIKRTFFKDKEVNTVVMPTYSNGAAGISLVHRFEYGRK